jgi:hypothetical protein
MKELVTGMNARAKTGVTVISAVVLVLVLLLTNACTTTSQKNEGKEIFVASQNKIIILSPTLRYESIEDESELDSSRYGAENVGKELRTSASTLLKKAGFKVLDSEDFSKRNLGFKAAYERLREESTGLFRSSIDSDLTDNIKEVGEYSGHANIVAIHFKVILGPGFYWDPVLTEQIIPEMSRSRFKAVLVDSKNGRALWKNEVLFSEVPKPENRGFIKAINLLFQNLRSREEE